MKTTMKAIRMHQYGGPEVLRYEDAPLPSIGPEDVLVAVHAAAVNPVDWKVREGYLRERVDFALPMIPGWDLSGRVESVGSAVTALQPGDEVFGRADLSRDGSYAEYVAVRASELAPKPRGLNHVEAAAVPLTALTAWQALFQAAEPYRGGELVEGQRVLIHGAAGGVGSFAVQLARWRGAYVIGTGSAHSADYLLDLGVNEFINYEVESFEEVTRDIDVVLDTVGGETQERSWRVISPGGVLVSIVSPPSEELAAQHDARAAFVFVQANSTHLAQISELIETGFLRPVVSNVLPLTDAREAQEQSRSGHTHGKIVLDLMADREPSGEVVQSVR